MKGLKELRIEKKLTQREVADLVGISLRSYKSYENDENKRDTLKYRYIMEQLEKINFIDEEHGLLTVSDITRKCSEVFTRYNVKFCYLFGSYAKGKETPSSDVDLLISADVKGIKFYGLVEELRETLCKKVDLLDINQLKDNLPLMEEILKDGIKIYG
ncbi:MAG TPA: helix-turn-helix domain-containing protein [Candidatus Mediterraneibacter guildfordensis]|nr:helix-turn-helix domain-containing protein [Candidatus Mediterraneibacter guildfordensis]